MRNIKSVLFQSRIKLESINQEEIDDLYSDLEKVD